MKRTLNKTKVLRLRLKDKHAKFLRDLAREVNFVWNYCNELQITMFNRERRFLSGYDFAKFTRGATKEGLHLHSQTGDRGGIRHAAQTIQKGAAELAQV